MASSIDSVVVEIHCSSYSRILCNNHAYSTLRPSSWQDSAERSIIQGHYQWDFIGGIGDVAEPAKPNYVESTQKVRSKGESRLEATNPGTNNKNMEIFYSDPLSLRVCNIVSSPAGSEA